MKIEERLLELKQKAGEYNRARMENVYKLARWATDDEAAIAKGLVSLFDCDRVIECGTANGWSALWFAAAGCKVETFDPHNRPKLWDAPFQTDDRIKELAKNIRYHQRPFDEFPDALKNIEEGKGGWCWFIDGDHTYENAKKDWDSIIKNKNNYSISNVALDPEMDIIIIHDVITEVGVKKLWKQIKRNPEFSTTQFYSKRGVGVIRCT